MAKGHNADQPSNARLHKRGGSLSSIGSPMTSPKSWHTAKTGTSRKNSRDEFVSEKKGREGVRIKPYLRKLSTKEDGGLDLSLPAAENERIAGLGIYEPEGYGRSVSDVSFTHAAGRQRHRRSTSNTSQFSTSSGQRPSMPYAQPMRYTPRPYTPPVARSYANSTLNGEEDDEADDTIMSEDDFRFRQQRFDSSRRSGSLSSTSAIRPALTLNTSRSFTKLGAASSQSSLNISSPPIVGRPRGDTKDSSDSATSPIATSRPSFEKFSFKRKDSTPLDPRTRAQEIQLAREAFKERELAKSMAAEKEALKQADRDARKNERKVEREQKKEQRKRSMSTTNAGADEAVDEKGAKVVGREYDGYRPSHVRSMPVRFDTKRTEETGRGAMPTVTKTKRARSRWMAFVVWLRTRFLRRK